MLFHSRGSAEGRCRTNKKQRAQRSGKPALSYPRKRVSSGTRRGGARLAPGGSSKQPKFRQRRGILDARVRGHDARNGVLVQGDRPQAGTNSQRRGSWLTYFWASPNLRAPTIYEYMRPRAGSTLASQFWPLGARRPRLFFL